MYNCITCIQTFRELDMNYHIHIINCVHKRLDKLDESIKKLRNKLTEQESDNALNIRKIHETHSDAIVAITQHYEKMLEHTKINPQIEFLESQLEHQKNLYSSKFTNDIELIRKQHLETLSKERQQYTETITHLKHQIQENNTKHSEELARVVIARDAMMKRITEMGKSIAHYTNALDTLNRNINTDKKTLEDMHTREIKNLINYNKNYDIKIKDLQAELQKFSRIEQRHLQEINKVKDDTRNIFAVELSKFKDLTHSRISEISQENTELKDSVTNLTETINVLHDIETKYNKLQEEHSVALRRIEEWKKYALFKSKKEEKPREVRSVGRIIKRR
jgi:chromosome segregation ATPase